MASKRWKEHFLSTGGPKLAGHQRLLITLAVLARA